MTTCCSVLSPEIVMHDDARWHIGGRSENNINASCVTMEELNNSIYSTSDFLSFIVVELIWFFHRVLTGRVYAVQVIKLQQINTRLIIIIITSCACGDTICPRPARCTHAAAHLQSIAYTSYACGTQRALRHEYSWSAGSGSLWAMA